jgi:hypothetical protein
MCIFIWARGDKVKEEQDQSSYSGLISKFSSAKPVELGHDLRVKVHQNYVAASKRPDSITLPMYANYCRSNKR